jgi:putative endonuclease
MDWFIYMARCRDGSLYTGITNDVERRMIMHNKGTGAKYTRSRGPVRLVYLEGPCSRSDALKRERQLKRFPKKKKEILAVSQSAVTT